MRRKFLKTILLVEDEAIIALSERKSLEKLGYSVVLASNGKEAMERALHGDPPVDLVLMDIDLGSGMDGTEAARRILSERNLPIVFLTAHAEQSSVEKVRGITRYGYIIKNLGNFVLQSSIEMAFELYEAHERLRLEEARLKSLVKAIPDLVWLKDREGNYLECNSAFEHLVGLTEEELIGKCDFDLFDDQTAESYKENDRKALELGSARSNEEWVIFKVGGSRALLETIKTPMFDDTDRLIGVLGIGRDITERKRLERDLIASERKVKDKLNAITSPQGDIGALELSEIIDIPTLTNLMESFSSLTGVGTAVVDVQGTVLVATGWQEICTKFHRKNARTREFCTESDTFLAASVKPGEYVDYRCRNGLWDVVTPLYVESRHVGNIYTGQFFYDDDVVNEDGFLEQAKKYDFDTDAYLFALRRVPRFSRAQVALLMDYLVRFTDYISRLSVGNLRLARMMAEKSRTEQLLSKFVAEKEMLFKELQHRTKNSLGIVASLLSLSASELEDEKPARLFQEAANRVRSISMVYDKLNMSSNSGQVNLATYIGELARLLFDTYTERDGRITLTSRIESIPSDIKPAVALGLIMNELLTNALKYAYPAGTSGEIRLSLTENDHGLELRVSDDGPGLPPGLDVKKAGSLGLRIVDLLAGELEGELRFEKGPGTTAVLETRLPRATPSA